MEGLIAEKSKSTFVIARECVICGNSFPLMNYLDPRQVCSECIKKIRILIWEHDYKAEEKNRSSDTMIKKYRKKPVAVEALQYTGNDEEIIAFGNGDIVYDSVAKDGSTCLAINTLEGVMRISLNDYVIKGVNGEFYPCKPDIFEATYEEAT